MLTDIWKDRPDWQMDRYKNSIPNPKLSLQGFNKTLFCSKIQVVHYGWHKATAFRTSDNSVYQKINVLIQNICCGYSKELSQWDGSFEHPKHMMKLMSKKIFTSLRLIFFFIRHCWLTSRVHIYTKVQRLKYIWTIWIFEFTIWKEITGNHFT